NAIEHHELFLMPVWKAIGKSRWVVEARQLPWTISISIGVLLVSAILCLWPADFNLSGKGKLQPALRQEVFAKVDGTVIDVPVRHQQMVKKGEVLAYLQNPDLQVQIEKTSGELEAVRKQLGSVRDVGVNRGPNRPNDRNPQNDAELI